MAGEWWQVGHAEGKGTYPPALMIECAAQVASVMFLLAPVGKGHGEAAFLPLFAPHRVTNDDGVSVSWNVGFHTRKSLVRRDAHFVNYELRRWGVKPRPVGERPWADRLKGMAQWGVRAKNKVVRTVNGQKNCCEPSM